MNISCKAERKSNGYTFTYFISNLDFKNFSVGQDLHIKCKQRYLDKTITFKMDLQANRIPYIIKNGLKVLSSDLTRYPSVCYVDRTLTIKKYFRMMSKPSCPVPLYIHNSAFSITIAIADTLATGSSLINQPISSLIQFDYKKINRQKKKGGKVKNIPSYMLPTVAKQEGTLRTGEADVEFSVNHPYSGGGCTPR